VDVTRYRLKPLASSRQKHIGRVRRFEVRLTLMNILTDSDDYPSCTRCGFSNPNALQIDHKQDDGALDRTRFKSNSGMIAYYIRNPIEAKEKLQVLCANCNWIKRGDMYARTN